MTTGQKRLLERARDTALFILTLVIAFFTVTSLAQSQPVSIGSSGIGSGPMRRGNFLAPDQYATQGSLNLYVDGSGSGNDGFTCTQPETPCSTCQGALNRIPFMVSHPVNVALDGGNYAGCALTNHIFNAANITNGAYIKISGAPQSTLTFSDAGTATGTVTSVATDSLGYHVVSDSALGNATNDSNIQGRFLALTAGTGVGQVLPIVANGLTSFTVAGAFSPAPIAGTTYAITSPSTVITSSINSPAGGINAAGGAAGILASNLAVTRSINNTVVIQDVGVAGSFTSMNISAVPGMFLQRMRFAPTGGSIGIILGGSSNISISASSLVGSSQAGISISSGSQTPYGNTVSLTSDFLSGSGTADTSAVVAIQAPQAVVNATNTEILNTVASGYVSDIDTGGGTLRGTLMRLRCASSTGSFGFQAAWNANAGVSSLQSNFTSNTNEITGCGTGVRIHGNNVATIRSATSFVSNTLAVEALGGARVLFNSIPTFTTNTTDIRVDGADFTRAAFVALVPNAVTDLNYGTFVYLQP